ncbi:hypothetical protein [Pantoea sp. Marseille-Q5743]|uniref:hypothetical protein n=1 Tax=Pantoea sp. Marseille-Q5743 TaxID=2972776 RepID=UPI0021CAADF4|nr:hypothetical protein [Pantoea sp. Marseille-Q5743]
MTNQEKDVDGERVRSRRKYMEQNVQSLILKHLLNPSEPEPHTKSAPPKRPTAQEVQDAMMKFINSSEFKNELRAAALANQRMLG